MKPKMLVRLHIHQDFGHSLSVRSFAELSDRVRSDDGGGSQVPEEIASLVELTLVSPRTIGPQLAAFFTSARIFFSSAAVSSFSA